jgi:hypothetical protein
VKANKLLILIIAFSNILFVIEFNSYGVPKTVIRGAQAVRSLIRSAPTLPKVAGPSKISLFPLPLLPPQMGCFPAEFQAVFRTLNSTQSVLAKLTQPEMAFSSKTSSPNSLVKPRVEKDKSDENEDSTQDKGSWGQITLFTIPILVTMNSCESLKTTVNAILDWSKSRGEDPPPTKINCEETPDLREFDVTDLVPSFVRRMNGEFSNQDGPNCFNCALVEVGVRRMLMYTSPQGWRRIIEQSFSLVEKPETIPPGAVVAIRQRASDKRWVEVHGFTYINQEISFSKNGYDRRQPYLVQSTSEVLEGYEVKNLYPDCINPPLNHIPRHCEMFLSVYTFDPKKHSSNSGR